MIWFPERLPDEQMTPFKPGDLLVPRKIEYYEHAAIFLGLSWEPHKRRKYRTFDGRESEIERRFGEKALYEDEDGWCVYPYVYTPLGNVWGTSWDYIEHCELLSTVDDRKVDLVPMKYFWPNGFETWEKVERTWYEKVLIKAKVWAGIPHQTRPDYRKRPPESTNCEQRR